MAISAGVCDTFTQELFSGTHTNTDTYKIALYTSSATLSSATTAYTASGEVAGGTGYTTTGQDLTGFSATLDTGVAILDFTGNPSWTNATITARGAMIYNSSKSNKAVAILDFGSDIVSTNGTFTVTFPAPTAGAGLIRIS